MRSFDVVAVVGSADAFRELVVQAVGHVSRAREHHVLEKVREPGATRRLVLRPDVVPDGHRDGRRGPVKNNGQAVRQSVCLKGNLDGRRPLRDDAVGHDDDRERNKNSAYCLIWFEIADHRMYFPQTSPAL